MEFSSVFENTVSQNDAVMGFLSLFLKTPSTPNNFWCRKAAPKSPVGLHFLTRVIKRDLLPQAPKPF